MKKTKEGCLGYWSYTIDGNEFDCEYEYAGEITCEHCIYGFCGGNCDPSKPPRHVMEEGN